MVIPDLKFMIKGQKEFLDKFGEYDGQARLTRLSFQVTLSPRTGRFAGRGGRAVESLQ